MKLIFDVSVAAVLGARGQHVAFGHAPCRRDPITADCAAPRISEKLKPNFASTITVISPAPPISRTALMICTQVVPFMPPTST